MATYAKHGTLVANTVATVTLAGAHETLEVMNRSGVAEIYFSVSAAAGAPAAPTVGGDDCFVVPAAAAASYVVSAFDGGATVKLISSGTPTYSVIGGQPA